LKIIPAVDISKGKTVRLYQGKADSVKVYDTNPIETAKAFENPKIDIIHVIDLDAAMGLGDNSEIIINMAKQLDIRLQVGGGIRDINKAKHFLNNNVYRVIIGTAILKQPSLCSDIAREYGRDRIIAAVDHFRGEIKVKGWLETIKINLFNYVKLVEELNPGYILLTSIESDGTMKGPDTVIIEKVSRLIKIPIIAAGGIASLNDLKILSKFNLYGVIIGKALYEKAFTLKQALEVSGG
jgi:phosphoribosylformimino-5-aminoimidazole carboxamide ribotide isomerase